MLGLDGNQPSNLIAIVHAPATELRVTALAQAYYRVVAVDAAGTRGGASRMAAIPRPDVYSCPVTTATRGKPYVYRLVPALAFGSCGKTLRKLCLTLMK